MENLTVENEGWKWRAWLHCANVASGDTGKVCSLPGGKTLAPVGLAAVLAAAGSFQQTCSGALAETLAPAGANAKYRAERTRARRKATAM